MEVELMIARDVSQLLGSGQTDNEVTGLLVGVPGSNVGGGVGGGVGEAVGSAQNGTLHISNRWVGSVV